MNIIDRVKNILLTPKTEWEVIDGETATPVSLLTKYVLPLAAAVSFVGILLYAIFSGVIGAYISIGTAIIGLAAAAISFIVTSYIADALAPSFDSEKNLSKSAQLVAYSFTAAAVGGLFSFIPFLGWFIAIAALAYGAYLMYEGVGALKKTPEDKKIIYVIVIYGIWIAAYFIFVAIFSTILFSILAGGAIIGGGGLR